MVYHDIQQLDSLYLIREVAFDRGYQGVHFGTRLQSHFGEGRVVSFPQGILSMNPPFRELQELLLTKRIHHDRNPVLRWMASNCAAEQRGGLTKPSKDLSSEKIDGITALVMGMGRAMLATVEAPSISWL